MSYKKILIAVDGSSCSLKAAKVGFELAHDLKVAIAILFVIDSSKEVVNADLGITPESSMMQLHKEAEETIQQYIKMYNGVGGIFRFTPEGHPGEQILNVAKDWEADLIVMGTHGRSFLEEIFTGSVAEHVIKNAEIPVMVVPSKMK